ncbi:MAG TPA: amidohydrolase family protein, partial [Dehalococcoidia bacterium]|nr:amidohydrolase family protein [Dehalococcoidia bacterium]
MSHDLIIRGGRIVDGTGLPGYLGDIAIRDGRIVEIGRIDGPADRVIDADGLTVAPGFIDHHTHFDAQILWDPLASSSCWHGVTTVVTGNCSLSLAPCKPKDRDGVIGSFVRVEAISRPALEAGLDWEWVSFGDYLNRIGRRLGTNVACLAGHSAIRQFVMGDDACDRTARPDEIKRMRQAVREAIDAGAIGLSVNQSRHHFREDGRPIPSSAAPREEQVELAAVLGELNAGMIQVNGGSMGVEVDPEENYRFLRTLAKASGRPILFNTISQRWQTPGVWQQALDLGAECLREGLRIHGTISTLPSHNQFTLANAQVMFDNMPTWRPLMFASKEERMAGFRDPARRPKLRYEALEDPTRYNFHKRWDLVTVKEAKRPENKRWEKQSIAAIAQAQGKHPVDAFLDLALAEDLETIFETSTTNGDP